MNDFKLPESYYQPPEYKCEYCERHEDECDCCLDCESIKAECECSPIAEYMPTAEDLRDDIVISFRLDKNLHNKLKMIATKQDHTVSQLIRKAVKVFLEKENS